MAPQAGWGRPRRRIRRRWRSEEFHRSWKKGGCDVERSQLASVDALVRWATILAALADAPAPVQDAVRLPR